MIFTCCCEKKQLNNETPFMAIVKLLSAEQTLNFEEARKYIDVNQVYSKYPESRNPEMEWMELLRSNYNLGKDPKFSNSINFYKYNIKEFISGENAVVSLKSKKSNSHIKEIIYKLLLINDQWTVVSIDYVK